MVTDFKKKKKGSIGRRLTWHVGGVLVLGMLAVLVVANLKIYHKKQELAAQLANLHRQVKDLQASNGDLRQKIEKSDDPQYVEKIAREELDLQKQGETAVSFIMPQAQDKNIEASQKNTWQAWLGGAWNWIKNIF